MDLYRDLPGAASGGASGSGNSSGGLGAPLGAPASRLNSALAFAPTSLRRPPPAANAAALGAGDPAGPPRRKRTAHEAQLSSSPPAGDVQQYGWSLFGGNRSGVVATSTSVLTAGLPSHPEAAPPSASGSGSLAAPAWASSGPEGNLVGENLYWDPPLAAAGDSGQLVREYYNPVKPNDFELHMAEIEAQRVRARQEMEALAEFELQLEQEESRMAARPQEAAPAAAQVPSESPAQSLPAPLTGEEAYLRRLQMSQQRSNPGQGSQPPPPRPQLQQQQPPADIRTRLKHESPMPTRVVMLRNMVGRGQVDPELEEETAAECQKHGKVLRCVVHEMPPQDSQGQSIPDSQAVRIFIEFAELPSAIAAYRHLDGRFFAQREVIAVYWDEIAFRNGKLG